MYDNNLGERKMKFSNVRKHSKKLGKAERLRDKKIHSISHMLYRYILTDNEKEVLIGQLKGLV